MTRIETVPQNMSAAEIEQIDVKFNQIIGNFGAEALSRYRLLASQYDGEQDEFDAEDEPTIIRSNN